MFTKKKKKKEAVIFWCTADKSAAVLLFSSNSRQLPAIRSILFLCRFGKRSLVLYLLWTWLLQSTLFRYQGPKHPKTTTAAATSHQSQLPFAGYSWAFFFRIDFKICTACFESLGTVSCCTCDPLTPWEPGRCRRPSDKNLLIVSTSRLADKRRPLVSILV